MIFNFIKLLDMLSQEFGLGNTYSKVDPIYGPPFEVFGIDVIEVIDGERQNKLF